MAFVNPKEELMKILLTEYGKDLLSKGELVVKYYALFDDEVDYQSLISLLSGSNV